MRWGGIGYLSPMDAPEALARAQAGFGRRLADIDVPDWDKPTPCTEWSVRQLADHVVRCALLYRLLLDGARAEDILGPLRNADHLGVDPVDATLAAWDELAVALQEPGALTGVVHHPAGELPAAWLAVTAVEELTVHGWDLARATGGDETVDEEVAAWLLPSLREMLPALRGLFRTSSQPLPAGATPSAQLLHLTGRQ